MLTEKLVKYIRKFGQFFVYSLNDDGTYSVADFTDGVIEDLSKSDLLILSDLTRVYGVTEHGIKDIAVDDYVSRLVTRLKISGVNITCNDFKDFEARLAFMDKDNGYRSLLEKQSTMPIYGYKLESGRVYDGLLCAGSSYGHMRLSSPMLGAYYTVSDKLLKIALTEGIPVSNLLVDSSMDKNIEYIWLNDTVVPLRSTLRYIISELVRLYRGYCKVLDVSDGFESFFDVSKIWHSLAIKVKRGMQSNCFVCSYTDPSVFEFDRCSHVIFKAVVIPKEELIRRYELSINSGYKTIDAVVLQISEHRAIRNESDLKKWAFEVLGIICDSYVPSEYEYGALLGKDSLSNFFAVGLKPVELNYDRTIFG